MQPKLSPIAHLGCATLLVTLASCASSPSINQSPTSVSSASPESSQATSPLATPAATIAEIQQQPVWVRLLNATQETSAKEGMGLTIGETIRTQGQALAQVDLKNGLAFRVGGDSVLTLQPDNRLQLRSGDMITWIQPGQKVPSEIVTPIGIAGIRGTTVFVKVPKNPNQGTLFFAWEGAVSVRLPNQTEEVLLKTAEEVTIKPGERDIAKIRQRVRRLTRQEWRQKRQRDRLVHSFRRPLPTLSLINQLKPGQAALNEAVTDDRVSNSKQ